MNKLANFLKNYTYPDETINELTAYINNNGGNLITNSMGAATLGIAIHEDIQKAVHAIIIQKLKTKGNDSLEIHEQATRQDLLRDLENNIEKLSKIIPHSGTTTEDVANYFIGIIA